MKLFSWGANSHGQLGQNIVSEACCVPTEISSADLNPALIVSIVGGGGHTLLLNSSGKAYSCGWNNKGQCGIVGAEGLTFQPIESLYIHRVDQLACGWDSSLAITSDGLLLVWGSNNYSQLGSPKQKFSCLKTPECIPIARVKQASLGLRHLALVTEDGRVFVSGSGSKGQLGLVDSNGRPYAELQTLTQVPNLDNILSVSCGQHHTVVLSDVGKIYVWGDNRFGQLGLDSTVHPVVHVPYELSLVGVSGIKGSPSSVFAGWTHTVLTTDEGELVNWGRNIYGQLGVDREERTVTWKPGILKTSARVQQFAVGSEHNLMLTETGKIMSWGWNEHGNCGTGTQENVLMPAEVQMKKRGKATLIGSGACHSFVLLNIN